MTTILPLFFLITYLSILLFFFETYVDFAKKDVSENTNLRQRHYAAIASFSFEQEKKYSLKSTLKKNKHDE